MLPVKRFPAASTLPENQLLCSIMARISTDCLMGLFWGLVRPSSVFVKNQMFNGHCWGPINIRMFFRKSDMAGLTASPEGVAPNLVITPWTPSHLVHHACVSSNDVDGSMSSKSKLLTIAVCKPKCGTESPRQILAYFVVPRLLIDFVQIGSFVWRRGKGLRK